MGKYGASLIHEWWSDWHYKSIPRIKKVAFLADIDCTCTKVGNIPRIWAEMRKKDGIVAFLELKWKWTVDLEIEKVTVSEIILSNFYEEHGKPFYIIVIDPLSKTPTFEIHRPYLDKNKDHTEPLANLSENEMMEWINADYDPNFLTNVNHQHLSTKLESFA